MSALCAVCLFPNHDMAVIFASAAACCRQMMRFLHVTDLPNRRRGFRTVVILLPSFVWHKSLLLETIARARRFAPVDSGLGVRFRASGNRREHVLRPA
ncbi:MAG: hypothetical protein QOJ64_1669 [Acidobacteriota bacterium]|nr:hypothetical protein [Acidobacteriota bacterium]